MTKFLHNVIQRIRSRREGRTRTTYDVRFDDVGLTVRRLTMENETSEEFLRWDDAVVATVFKRDLFSVDCICLTFQKTDGTWFEINEDCKGWRDLLPELPRFLDGCTPADEWLKKVTLPPFELNGTEIYRRLTLTKANGMTPDRERVAGLIREAFGGVALGGGVGLWQGQALDDYADEKMIAAARLRDEKTDWGVISADDLNHGHSSLCFFDAEGMRFHLPAFLLAQLAGTLWNGVLFNLTDLDDYGRSQFAVLSTVQRKAVCEFLLLFKDDPDCEFERSAIENAIADFWKDRDTPPSV